MRCSGVVEMCCCREDAGKDEEETSLTAVFEELDDRPWPPPELRPNDQTWRDYEVDEEEARAHVIESLIGGSIVGHTRKAMPRRVAIAVWEKFRGLFSANVRSFMYLGLGDPSCIFAHGVIVVDEQKAGCLYIVEND